MGEAVAHDKVVYLEHHIVAAYLFEHLLRDVYRGCLVLDDDPRMQRAVVDYRVASAAHAVDFELHLVGHKRPGVALVAGEEMHEMLSYPFLRRQRHILAADRVENERFVVLLCYFFIESG